MENLDFLKDGYINKHVLLLTLDSPFLDNSLVFPYLGILYLTAVAKKLGLDVCYINNSNLPLTKEKFEHSTFFYTDEFDAENIHKYKDFDLIGISCLTSQAQQAYSIRNKLKSQYPHMKIMIGGAHTKGYLADCIRERFDIICFGDGERVFESILTGDIETLKSSLHPYSTSKTVVFQDRLNEPDMNSFPIPFRQKEYISRYRYILEDRSATTLINSRGCCMGCEFCEDRFTGLRWYSPQHFNAQIESIISLSINGIMIFDDLFAFNPKKLSPYLEILKKYQKTHNLIFRCFGHSKAMSMFPEMADMLVQAGCVELGFGAESASQEILDRIGKGTRVEGLHNLVNLSVKAGINVKAFFMIGLPGETKETFRKTYDFIKKYRELYPDHFNFDLAVFFPYKGTKIGRIARLPEGVTLKTEGKEYTHKSVQLRPISGLIWEKIDSGNFGAYKKKGGASDIVIETYDWQKNKVLLTSREIYELKEQTMLLSPRYTNREGKRIFSPSIEGDIGAMLHKDDICA